MPRTSFVREYNGQPTLFVDEKPCPGPAYMTYLAERGRFADFAAIGCKLFSASVFFASRGVNAAGIIAPFEPGVFEQPDKMNLQPVWSVLQKIRAACPDAGVLLRVNTNLPEWWENAHPQECNDAGYNGQPPRPCFASEEYAAACEQALCRFIAAVEQSDYADTVIGYQVAGGQTEEWLSLDNGGNNGPALRHAFLQTQAGKPYASQVPESDALRALLPTLPAFRAFAADTVAAFIARLARAAKRSVAGQKVVGAFYGYTFETPWWQIAHGALAKLLPEPCLDFLCSPLSYQRLRPSGLDWACMTVLDTVLHSGKLYFAEADVRTCLSRPLGECRENGCKPGTYDNGIWFGPGEEWECRQQLKAVYARSLTHGYALWWFDMWGGWYASEGLMHTLAECQNLTDGPRAGQTALQQPKENRQDPTPVQLAVFTDERAVNYLSQMNETTRQIMFDSRAELGSCGVPYRVYNISDYPAVRQQFAVAVFLAPYLTEALKDAIAQWRKSGRPYLAVTPEQPVFTAADVSRLCRSGGILPYAPAGDVVYAGNGWLALHAATAGQKQLHLPRTMRVTPVWPPDWEQPRPDRQKTVNTDHIVITVRRYETILYKLETIESDDTPVRIGGLQKSVFCCPVCGGTLYQYEKNLQCSKQHSFDRARAGYVNLLQSQVSSDKRHGDDAYMVAARTRFLDGGWYDCLLRAVCEKCNQYVPRGSVTVLDAGCGEGRYTARVCEALQVTGRTVTCAGVDISRAALAAAHKRNGLLQLAVGSVFQLPMAGHSAHLVLNIFAPSAPEEYARVLRRNGLYICVVPREKHLWELKAAVYDTPYENPPVETALAGFTLLEQLEVNEQIHLTDNQTVQDLFAMTPYYYKTAAKDQQKLRQLTDLQVTLAFSVLVYRKK